MKPGDETSMTYESAGVSRGKAEEFTSMLRSVLSCEPSFFGRFPLEAGLAAGSELVASADGLGTKASLLLEKGLLRRAGEDLVAVNLNDLACCGAKPLFFLDYLSVEKLEPELHYEIIQGISEACTREGVSFIGGETAEMPGHFRQGEYGLAGFAVGAVGPGTRWSRDLCGEGNAVVGLRSNGIHANGFSLAIAALGRANLTDDHLAPVKSYGAICRELAETNLVTSAAHVTGGGLDRGLKRLVASGCNVEFNREAWNVPEVFREIQTAGAVSDDEMFATFNMGVGFLLSAQSYAVDELFERLEILGEEPVLMGRVDGAGK